MKNSIPIPEIIRKAKRYFDLQQAGITQIEAMYRVFGNTTGDELVREKQHEIILEKPILN